MTDPISPATLEVVIYQGNDRAKERELREAADIEARNAGVGRVGDAVRAAAQARDAFVAEMADRATVVTVQAYPPELGGARGWRKICRKHAPRKDNLTDEMFGYDTEAVAEEVMAASIIAPAFATDEEREAFLNSIRNSELTEIEFAICQVNDGDLGDPKAASMTSVVDRIAEENSSAPRRLA